MPAERWGVVMATCNAGLLAGERWYRAKRAERPRSEARAARPTPQAACRGRWERLRCQGAGAVRDTACAAGANAIGYAARADPLGSRRRGVDRRADALSDVLTPGFNSLESLSPKPAQPYSQHRSGLSLGEGSGMLVLIREDLARKFGRPSWRRSSGYGLSADGYHPTAPHPEGKGASRAIRAGLNAAGLTPDRVQYVNSHGTGTRKNDPAETRATRLGLGAAADTVAVSSTKSMIGHLLGAAGAVEGIVTVKALQEQIAPPTANYDERDPECDLDYVPNTARPMAMDIAISNNFAFGGANASVTFGRAGVVAAAAEAGLRPGGRDRSGHAQRGRNRRRGRLAGLRGQARLRARRERSAPGARPIGSVAVPEAQGAPAHGSPRHLRRGRLALALKDAGLELNDANRERVGVIFGTGVGPMESMENFSRPLMEEGPQAANPAVFPNTVYNAAGGQVAMNVGAIGPASTVTAGHAAGASSLCYGYDLAATGQADAMICLAVDTLTDTVISAYRDLGLLTNNAEVGGFALAEAGIALVLERASLASSRGARIYGEMLGFGIASDGRGVGRFDREGQGAERAMRIALDRSGLGTTDVKAVWTSAAGYRPADEAEERAIRRLFGESVQLVSPKHLMGEPMGAGGALNAALALSAWQHPDGGAAPGPILINSASLGGTHFTLVLAPYPA